ncbi:MAG: 4-alpha-glucanotransferase [Pyrinomonadaceae bacterium]
MKTEFPRGSGILLHPTSLPGEFGIGDLGPEAFRFVDFLARSGQKYWQILPLGPTGYGDSPYASFSAFAGNTLLISPNKLVEDGLLSADDIAAKPDFPNDKADFGAVFKWKSELLPRVFEKFLRGANVDLAARFDSFCRENSFWLEDYALYRSLKTSHEHKPWYKWPDALRLRDKSELHNAAEQLSAEIAAQKFFQFLFFRQWFAVKDYANQNGVSVIGDLPIFVALDSVDVWCNQDKLKLNEDGTAKFIAGVPPDFFSETGQLWGNPIYDWEAMRQDNFGWWTARIAFALKMADIVRLDHFIGFVRNWAVPGGDETAENGEWLDVPGRDLFSTLKTRLGELPLIAEDLGAMTQEIADLRDDFGFAGMRILENAFGGDANNHDLPHNYIEHCVAYTGTHDNDTAVGWYKSTTKNVRHHCRKYLRSSAREIHWDMIRAVMASVANTTIFPMQDVLGLGSDSRMNTPSTTDGNWQWRLNADALTDDLSARLREFTEMYGRF